MESADFTDDELRSVQSIITDYLKGIAYMESMLPGSLDAAAPKHAATGLSMKAKAILNARAERAKKATAEAKQD